MQVLPSQVTFTLVVIVSPDIGEHHHGLLPNRATRAVKSSIGTGSREAREPERRPCDFMVTPTS